MIETKNYKGKGNARLELDPVTEGLTVDTAVYGLMDEEEKEQVEALHALGYLDAFQ